MTNPNNAVGTNAAYGGRTSVNAFNDWANFYSRGIVSGWIGAPSSGMTIQFGGLAGVRDVALAEDPNGNKTTINNTTTSPVPVTVAAASTTSNRQDVVVAYVNSPAEVSTTTVDNPGACGIIAVPGSASSAPNDSAIRAAITSDGGTGTTAYYVILAVVAVSANTTTITSEMILQNGFYAQVAPANILPSQSISSDKIDFSTFALDELFSGSATSSFTLSKSISNYNKIYVQCAKFAGQFFWNTILVSHATSISGQYIGAYNYSSGLFQQFLALLNIENTSASLSGGLFVNVYGGDRYARCGDSKELCVYKVLGE